jgi:3-dehydroquinate dehydratase/shikimate dehydrogenase
MKEQSTARICVPVCVKSANELADAIARAESVADVVELRADYLQESELDAALDELRKLKRAKPLILTFRPSGQGGRRGLSLSERASFWLGNQFKDKARQDFFDYSDIELDLLESEYREQLISTHAHSRIICSQHDFTGTPADLEKIYERMSRTSAHILKLAFRANDVTDCIPVLRLLERARREGRELISMPMGEAGVLTRIIAPSRGAFLTCGSLDSLQATAPGQLKATELRDLYRIHELNCETEIMGLVGQPVSHSFSPQLQNRAFAASHINAVYVPFEVHRLDDFMRRMVTPRTREMDWNLRGLSVTAPHKLAIMKHLDWVEPSAQEIGAVNTVVIEGERLLGYNTDAKAALVPLLELIDLSEARVAVIGSGGAARTLLWSLRQARARVTVFARDVRRAEETARQFGAGVAGLVDAGFGDFELVVNATPLGTRGLKQDETPALGSQLRGARIAYDLVYNPRRTRFMREALKAGCRTLGGMDMLVAQAAAQFKLWTRTDAPLEAMREAGEKAVTSNE